MLAILAGQVSASLGLCKLNHTAKVDRLTKLQENSFFGVIPSEGRNPSFTGFEFKRDSSLCSE